MTEHYHLGLLYLLHSLVSSDGIIDKSEQEALLSIKERDQISEEIFARFEHEIRVNELREIYEQGIRSINLCSEKEKLNAFSTLYRMSEVDGRIHIKEVRLLLHSIKAAGIEFNDVVKRAEILEL